MEEKFKFQKLSSKIRVEVELEFIHHLDTYHRTSFTGNIAVPTDKVSRCQPQSLKLLYSSKRYTNSVENPLAANKKLATVFYYHE